MRTRAMLQMLLMVGLLVTYSCLVVAILRPRVSPEYRAYFIDQTSTDWNPVRYPATPEQGIVFSAQGLPTFVRSMTGLSYREAWGRWTDTYRSPTTRIFLTETLRGTICLDVRAHPSTALRGKPVAISLGNETKQIVLNALDFADYLVQFDQPFSADMIEFRFQGAVPRENTVDRRVADARRLGLAMIYLRLYMSPCSRVQHQLDEARNSEIVPDDVIMLRRE